MIRLFFLCSVILTFLNAKIVFEDIDSKPPSRAKNFMIWQYLKQDITSKQADMAYAQVLGNIWKIKKEYLKKSSNITLKKEIECRNKKDILSIKEKKCLKLALNPYKTLKLSKDQREQLLKRVDSKTTQNFIKIQSEKHSEKSYISYDANTILTIFISTTSKNRRDNLDLLLSKKFIDKIFSKDASNWKKFSLIKIILNDKKLKNLQKSIRLIDGQNVDSDSNFLLGLNQLKHSNIKKALEYFNYSQKKATRAIEVDKVNFWMYLATKDEMYLKKLLKSIKINIYTLYAHEKLGSAVENYFSSVGVVNDKSEVDICDPFVWNKIMKEIKETPKNKLFKLANKYNQKNMSSVQSFILEKANGFKVHGYVMPYDEYLKDISIDDKALVYALMRQESNMIPSALSRSFALGLMQIMPFVVDDLSKKVKHPISCYDDMFQPSYNITYALKHLKWMKKSLYHPLFIAYAYNGGMGYFRRHLKGGTFNKGKYEPYMSMELMLNKQSREYGKRVLSNYVMFKRILGEKVSIIDLFENLTDPKKTDRFR
jgi:soluble lytic murein transglycosylase